MFVGCKWREENCWELTFISTVVLNVSLPSACLTFIIRVLQEIRGLLDMKFHQLIPETRVVHNPSQAHWFENVLPIKFNLYFCIN